MKGYAQRKGNRYYAVIYEGLDPVTGKQKRSWHPAGTDRAEAEQLARRLAAERNGRNDHLRSLTFGAFLTSQWHPAKRRVLEASTYRGYVGKTERHILPALGKIGLRRLRVQHLEQLYDSMLFPTDGRRTLTPKTVYDVHLIIRGALDMALQRGLVTRNGALAANAPKMRSIPKVEQQAWTGQELRRFLREAAGHRLFPALWTSAFTGMRRSSSSPCAGTTSTSTAPPSRSTVVWSASTTSSTTSAARHPTPGDAPTSTRPPWRCWPPGGPGSTPPRPPPVSPTRDGCSPTPTATPYGPKPSPRPSTASPAAPVSPSSACTICATPTGPCSSPPACPSRSSPNDSDTPPPRSRSTPTSTSCPGMQAEAARTFEALVAPGLLPDQDEPAEERMNRRKNTA